VGSYTLSSATISSGAANILHRPYSTEAVTWTSTWKANGGQATDTPIAVNHSNITVDGFTLSWLPGAMTDTEKGFFRVGFNATTANNFTLKNCAVTTDCSGDNDAFVHAKNTDSNGLTIKNCTFYRSSYNANENTAFLVIMHTNSVLISNNEFTGGSSIYFKYANDTVSLGPTIINNYFYNCKSATWGRNLHTLSKNGVYRNNIFNACGAVSFGDSYTEPNGYGNLIDHNTFYNTQVAVIRSQSTGNTITNNIFVSGYYIDLEDGPATNSFNSNYNLMPATGTVAREANYTVNTLAQWKTKHQVGDILYHDTHSVGGTPDFVGTPTAIANFALDTGSPGLGSCADNSDMGADVALVGTGNTPDIVNPSCSITSPTSSSTYDNGAVATINIGGVATDDTDHVTWSNDRDGSGRASGTTTWTVTGIALYSGSNVLSVTSWDAANNSFTDTLTVTYTPSGGVTPVSTPGKQSIRHSNIRNSKIR
jgi:hypothetical protein